MAFACIIFAVIGAIINRKTKQVKVEKSKTFLFGAIVSAIIVTIGLSFVIIDSVGNFVSIWDYYKYNDYPSWYLQYLDQPGAKVILADVIGSALQMVVMVIFMCAMFIPAAVKVHLDKKRGVHHHSHKAY
jgi:nucleoside recognition membrane protein YjiH